MRGFFTFILIFGLATLNVSKEAVANPCLLMNDGNCWNSLAASQKQAVIWGVWSGSHLRDISRGLAGDAVADGRGYVPLIDHSLNPLNGNTIRNGKLPGDSSIDHSSVSLKTTAVDIIRLFDKLYASPVNLGIRWEYAYILAALDLRGDDSNDREGLLNFLRNYGGLPTEAVLLKVIDVNEFEVRIYDQHVIRLRLAGVSSVNDNAEVKTKALKFLRALKEVTHSAFVDGCSKMKGGDMGRLEIEFHDDLFDKNGVLSAYVSVDGFMWCKGEERIHLQDLLKGGTITFNINRFLLYFGLANEENIIDPPVYKEGVDTLEDKVRFWRDRLGVRTTRLFWTGAEDAGFYLHGGKLNPMVERIVGRFDDDG